VAEAGLVAFVKANRVMVGPADEIGFAIPAVRGARQSENVFIVIGHFVMLDDVESEKSKFDHPHGCGSPLLWLEIPRPHALAGALGRRRSHGSVGIDCFMVGYFLA